MSDPELARDILANIMTAITRIERRFHGISDPDDFLLDNEGKDAIQSMQMEFSDKSSL